MATDWSTLRGLLIDLDGVVYTGRDPILGAAGFLAEARRRGLRFLLVTNNSTTSPELVAERLRTVLKYIEAERVHVTPDCGFSQTARWIAIRKLASLVEGVRRVRRELGR